MGFLACPTVVCVIAVAASLAIAATNVVYIERGLPEIDRGAAAWVLKTFVTPDLAVVFADQSNMPPGAVTIDFAGATIERRGNETAFEAALRYAHVTNSVAQAMIPLLRDIELNKWGRKKTAEAPGILMIHNGLLFSKTNEWDVMKVQWEMLDALFAYHRKMPENQ